MKIKTIAIGAILVLAVAFWISYSQLQESAADNKIRVAFFPNVGHAIPIVGLEQGFFSEGLNGTAIETKIFDSGPQVIESLFANSLDIAYVGPGPAINGFLKSENHNIVILAGAASGGASFVVHPDSDIGSPDEFDGKKIAAPQIANTQDVSLRYFLSEQGLKTADKGGSVYVLNIPNPEIYTLFTKGDIDAAWVPEPWATIFVKDLGGKRLFHEEELWPQNKFASVLLIARADFANSNPLTIQKWLDVHEQIVLNINENPDETVKIFNNFMEKEFGKSFSNEVIAEAFNNLEITSDPIPNSIELFAQKANSLGYLGRNGYSLDGLFYDANDVKTQGQEVKGHD